MSGWRNVVPNHPSLRSYQHVMPEDDIIEHEPTPHCICFPRKALLEDGPHVIAVQFIHVAQDGRRL